MTATLAAIPSHQARSHCSLEKDSPISSILYASASFATARHLNRCCLTGLIAGFLPPPPVSPPPPIPLLILSAPNAAALNPEAALTAISDASSTSCRMVVMPRKTAGSNGGGSRSSTSMWYARASREEEEEEGGCGVDLRETRSCMLLLASTSPRSVGRASGLQLTERRDCNISRGSCNHGPW